MRNRVTSGATLDLSQLNPRVDPGATLFPETQSTRVKFTKSGVILGRWSNGAGWGEEIEIGENLSLVDGVLSATVPDFPEVENTDFFKSDTAPDPAENPQWCDTTDGTLNVYHGTAPDGVWVNVSHEEDAEIPPALVQTIAFCGDSITGNVSGYQVYVSPVAVPGFMTYSFGGFAARKNGFKFTCPTNEYAPGGSNSPDLDFGWSGITAWGYLNQTVNEVSMTGDKYPGVTLKPIDVALAANADAHVLLIGTNDVPEQSAATVLARVSAVATALAASEKPLFIGEILPRTSTGDPTNTMQDTIDTVNAGLPALCDSLGAVLVPWADAMKTEAGLANPDMFSDETLGGYAIRLHPNATGHSVMGLILAEVMADYCRTSQITIPAEGSPLWATSNPYMTGSSGGLATGYLVQYASAANTIYTDGDLVTWQQINQTDINSTTALAEVWSPFISQERVDALIASQTPLRAVCRYQIVDGKCGNLALAFLGKNSGGTILRSAHCGNHGAPYVGAIELHSGLMVTEKFTMPAGISAANWRSQATVIIKGGGTVRLTQFGIFEDP